MANMDYALSQLDLDRFGVVTAKVTLDELDDVAQMMQLASKDGVQLLIVRTPTSCLDVAQRLEASGAFLADTLVYFQKKQVSIYDIQLPEGYHACVATEADVLEIEALAKSTFQGYYGHYHADSRLEPKSCDDVYSSWAKNSCLKGALADEVVLLKKNSEIAAFATLKIKNEIDFEGVLFGVSPSHRSKGLHLKLMQLAENWGGENGCRRLLTSTQITNVTVQKNWCRVGMEPLNSFYTFHLWMNQ
jgi:GNAT superfamily N-acetyltransferase